MSSQVSRWLVLDALRRRGGPASATDIRYTMLGISQWSLDRHRHVQVLCGTMRREGLLRVVRRTVHGHPVYAATAKGRRER